MAPPPAAPAPAEPRRPEGSARVHVSVDYPNAALELRSVVDQGQWAVACRAPCDRVLFVDGMEARVSANGMTTSNPFRIEPGRGTARFRVSGGSTSSRQIGVVSFLTGLPLALVGAGMWGYGRVENQSGLKIAGVVTMAVGGVLVVGALPFLSMGSTRVRNVKGTLIGKGFAPPPM
jgi:hypothetical protein